MTLVKDLICKTMRLVGRFSAAETYEEGGEMEGEEAYLVKNLLYCFNAVADELVRHYFPVSGEEELEVTDGALYFSQFENAPLKVYSVTDASGKKIAYKLFPDRIETDAEQVRVRYAALHSQKGESEESGLDERMSDYLVTYGMASEYCLINGEFELSQVWESRYRAELDRALSDLPGGGYLPPRRWV